MKISYLLLFAFAVGLTACTRPQEKLAAQIKEQEESLFAGNQSQILDTSKANAIVNLYLAYADQYPDDTLSADMLFKAGDITNGLGRIEDAITFFGRVQRYPNYQRTPDALFLQGFITENTVGNPDAAKSYYDKFLQQYPNHKLAEDVKMSIKNLGKSPEELIQMFEANNVKLDSLAVK